MKDKKELSSTMKQLREREQHLVKLFKKMIEQEKVSSDPRGLMSNKLTMVQKLDE